LHLAVSSLFYDEARKPILLGLYSRARSAASFARMLKTALQRMVICVPRGHWVKLVSAREVWAVCTTDGVRSRGEDPVAPGRTTPRPRAEDVSDEDVRIVHIH